MASEAFWTLWEKSNRLSQPYWTLYERLIGAPKFIAPSPQRQSPSSQQQPHPTHPPPGDIVFDTNVSKLSDDVICLDNADQVDWSDSNCDEDNETLGGMGDSDESDVDPEYAEFIRVTRKHQAERERLKRLDLKKAKKNPQLETYYRDISELDTLTEDNLVEPPSRKGRPTTGPRQRDAELTELYGSREAYDKIRNMEMLIDEHFHSEFRRLAPKYWPAIPINPKPYLNKQAP